MLKRLSAFLFFGVAIGIGWQQWRCCGDIEKTVQSSYYKIYTVSNPNDSYLKKHLNIKKAHVGDRVCTWHENDVIKEIKYYTQEGFCYVGKFDEDQTVSVKKCEIRPTFQKIEGEIRKSFYATAKNASIPPIVINQCTLGIKNFIHRLKPGTEYKLVFAGAQLPDGSIFKADMSFISMKHKDKEVKIYHVRTQKGESYFYDDKGRCLNAPASSSNDSHAFFRPVSTRKITSSFGARTDPFTKCRAYHKGIDYGAAYGAPVFATSNGVVANAGWAGNFGKLVEITHSGGYKTRYAHLSRVATRKGACVNKGDLIGYVGSTGRAHGVHLHYEVLRHNKQINPLHVPYQQVKKDKPSHNKIFKQHKIRIDSYLARA